VWWYVRFGLSYRDVHMTYSTTARGVDRLLFSNNILDLTLRPAGDGEDSPPGGHSIPPTGRTEPTASL
jgi:hypothetical protein